MLWQPLYFLVQERFLYMSQAKILILGRIT